MDMFIHHIAFTHLPIFIYSTAHYDEETTYIVGFA